MKEIVLNGVTIDLWTRELDTLAWQQIMNISKLPFIHHHVALMADGHGGAGVPIGCVLPVKGVVIPNAIGTDCGCGMRAVRSDIKIADITTDVLRKCIMRGIRKQIPVGDFAHKENQSEEYLPQGWDLNTLPTLMSNNGIKKIHRQIGTLGGGNHFIELQKDEEGYLWVMIHSGSRGVGGKLHQEYNQPSTIKEFCGDTFCGTSLEEIFLPEGLTRIGHDAFINCYHLKCLIIPSTVEYIAPWLVQGHKDFEGVACHSKMFRIEDDALISNNDNSLLACWTKQTVYNIPASVKKLRNAHWQRRNPTGC